MRREERRQLASDSDSRVSGRSESTSGEGRKPLDLMELSKLIEVEEEGDFSAACMAFFHACAISAIDRVSSLRIRKQGGRNG